MQTFPKLKNPITEYLASDPEDTQAEGRLKNAIEFATVDGILQGTLFLALKGIKGAAAKSAPDGDIDMALALENVKPADAKSVRQELARPLGIVKFIINARVVLQGSHAGVPDLPKAAKNALHKGANVIGNTVEKTLASEMTLSAQFPQE